MKATCRGKHDALRIERADGSVETLACPKQGIVPHEMVHLAVEHGLAARGFMSRVAAGEAAGFRMLGDADSDGVERLVEVFQGDAWSGGGTPAAQMLELYAVTCRERDCAPLPATEADVGAIRSHLAQLEAQWRALPVGGELTLAF